MGKWGSHLWGALSWHDASKTKGKVSFDQSLSAPLPSSHMLKAAPNCSPGRSWLHCELSAQLLGRKLIFGTIFLYTDRKGNMEHYWLWWKGASCTWLGRVKWDLVTLDVCVVCRMALSVLYQLKEIIWEENRLGIGRNFGQKGWLNFLYLCCSSLKAISISEKVNSLLLLFLLEAAGFMLIKCKLCSWWVSV